jgi:hypothetical protein
VAAGKTVYDCDEDMKCTVYTIDTKLELSPPKKNLLKNLQHK